MKNLIRFNKFERNDIVLIENIVSGMHFYEKNYMFLL